jgi:hypothetical protein
VPAPKFINLVFAYLMETMTQERKEEFVANLNSPLPWETALAEERAAVAPPGMKAVGGGPAVWDDDFEAQTWAAAAGR